MNADCLSTVLLFCPLHTIAKTLSTNKKTNKLNTNHLWKQLHTRDYEITNLKRDEQVYSGIYTEHNDKRWFSYKNHKYFTTDTEMNLIIQNKSPCVYCFNDSTTENKLNTKAYYELYKSHNIIICKAYISYVALQIRPDHGVSKCRIDNYKGNHVCVSCTLYNVECDNFGGSHNYYKLNNKPIGDYLPVKLFYGKKKGDTVTMKIFGKTVIATLCQEDAHQRIYDNSCTFGGTAINKRMYFPSLKTMDQYNMFIKAHQEIATSYGLEVKDPLTFYHSDNYRNKLSKCHGIIFFDDDYAFLHDKSNETTVAKIIKELCSLIKISTYSIDFISLFQINEHSNNSYCVYMKKPIQYELLPYEINRIKAEKARKYVDWINIKNINNAKITDSQKEIVTKACEKYKAHTNGKFFVCS